MGGLGWTSNICCKPAGPKGACLGLGDFLWTSRPILNPFKFTQTFFPYFVNFRIGLKGFRDHLSFLAPPGVNESCLGIYHSSRVGGWGCPWPFNAATGLLSANRGYSKTSGRPGENWNLEPATAIVKLFIRISGGLDTPRYSGARGSF